VAYISSRLANSFTLCSISVDGGFHGESKAAGSYSALVPTSEDARPGGRGNPNPDP
jgi:hypothetical protein